MPEAHRITRPPRPARARKRWATQLAGEERHELHGSEAAAYAHVARLRELQAVVHASRREMKVLVDEGRGRGWELYERVDLGE